MYAIDMCLRLLVILVLLNCNTNIKKNFLQWTNAFAVIGLSKSLSSTGTQTANATVGSPVIANLINNSIVQTGFLIGTSSGTVTSVEVSFDNGTYTPASGTASWKIPFPTGTAAWKDDSRHTISVRAANSGVYSSVVSISVIKGKNKDINGDGYSDLAVGAPSRNAGAGANQGVAYIFLSGGSTGINVSSAGSASAILTGQSGGDNFGNTLAFGDINGDGYADLTVGAPSRSSNQGAVYIFLSSGAAGISSGSATAANAVLTGQAASDKFGGSVSVGDFNGDGYSDLAAGAPNRNAGFANQGVVYTFLSTGSGGIASMGAASATRLITGSALNDQLGNALIINDLNGDGFADLISGASGFSSSQGKVYIFHSDSNGVIATSLGMATNSILGPAGTGKFGVAMTSCDLNGDGFMDLAVGADAFNSNQGILYSFHSSGSSGITATGAGSANTSISGPAVGSAHFGRSADCGNFNGDQYYDIVSGADTVNGATTGGAAYVFHSGASGISITSADSATVIINGAAVNGQMGQAVAAADLNGDGYSDLIASATQVSTAQGRTYIFHSTGSSGVSASSVSTAYATIAGQSNSDQLGTAISCYSENFPLVHLLNHFLDSNYIKTFL